MLEQLAADYGGRLKVAKLEMDRNPKATIAYGVRSVPSRERGQVHFRGLFLQANPTPLFAALLTAPAGTGSMRRVHPGEVGPWKP